MEKVLESHGILKVPKSTNPDLTNPVVQQFCAFVPRPKSKQSIPFSPGFFSGLNFATVGDAVASWLVR